MFTLQILDRGQTFLHTLDGRPVVIGNGPDVDLRLGEAEVVARHARIEMLGEQVRIVAMAKLLVNGRAVQRADLVLGDRIEIGRAVLVVGRAVARAARPDDVLADPPRGRTPRVVRRHSKALPLLAAAGLLAVVATFVLGPGGDAAHVQAELAMIHRDLDAGSLERAGEAIARWRREWAGATDDRLSRLDGEQQRHQMVQARVAELVAEVQDPAIERTYSQWNLELQRQEAEAEPTGRIAARIVRSSLRDTLSRRPERLRVPAPDQVAKGAGAGGRDDAKAPAAAGAPAPLADAVTEARRFAGQGLFAQAVAVLQAALGETADPAEVARLQAELVVVRADGVRAMEALLAEARPLAAGGKAREALTLLSLARHRFPGSGEFQPLAHSLGQVEQAVAEGERKVGREGARTEVSIAPPAPVVASAPSPSPAPAPAHAGGVDEGSRQATLALLRSQLDRIRSAEDRAAFAEAAALLREGAAMVLDRDADYAARLTVRAETATRLAAWHDAVAAWVAGGQHFEIALRAGGSAVVDRVEGANLVGTAAGAPAQVSWYEVAPKALPGLWERVHPDAGASLGVATLLYKGEEPVLAEALLAKVLRADGEQKAAIDRVVAAGRGEAFDPRGYTLGADGFTSVRTLEAQKHGLKLASRLDGLLRGKDPAAREAFLTEVLSQGPDALAALVVAFRKEFAAQVAKLDAGPLKKQVDRLAAQREQLDRVRQFAKDLIYDEVAYFYPYKPPAVSPDRFAEYNRVQAEVDRRVAEVRALWRDDRSRVKIPTSLQGDLDRLDWVAKVLGDLGELDAAALAQVDWARALPPGDTIGIAEFCRTPAERAELEGWRHIVAYNEIVQKLVGSSAREQLQVTNEYRAMFRHRPLALCLSISKASQGHAEEMSQLGYFAHMSPVPGRRTPFDRMKLAGYDFGVSENIALNDSAPGAHNAWCHSSGHHRNLLNAHHREFGIGVDGRNWVQNFGSGTTYERHEAWPQSAGKRPSRH